MIFHVLDFSFTCKEKVERRWPEFFTDAAKLKERISALVWHCDELSLSHKYEVWTVDLVQQVVWPVPEGSL